MRARTFVLIYASYSNIYASTFFAKCSVSQLSISFCFCSLLIDDFASAMTIFKELISPDTYLGNMARCYQKNGDYSKELFFCPILLLGLRQPSERSCDHHSIFILQIPT